MAKDDLVTVSGQVEKVLGGGRYLVVLDNKHKITAQLSGRMRRFHIRVITGDRVQCGVSPYDPTHGFITYREPPGGRKPDVGAGTKQ
jgi:translation initiation factor IF-1